MASENHKQIKSDIEIRKTLEEKLSLSTKVLDRFLPETPTGRSRDEVLAVISEDERRELIEIEGNAVSAFIGQLPELESALGMLLMGHHFGWKVLYLIHSKKTIRKYEDILGIKVREIFPETGPSSDRSAGLALAMKASNFWKVVSGEHKIENLKNIE
jgi:hypothetical protein